MAADRRDWKGSEVEDLDSLPPTLQTELGDLEAQFNVDAKRLKQISHRFEEELQEGLEKDGSNIVCPTLYTMKHSS